MAKRILCAVAALLALATSPVHAETVQFEGLQFETPADMARYDGPPRPPNTPFLRYRKGVEGDAQFDVIEVMSTPESALRGRATRETYADFALTPVERFCGEHQVLRNTTRALGGVMIVDIGFLCVRHSRSPELSRQVVRNVGVFHEGKLTMLQFIRRWRNMPHADDQLTPEEWMSVTDAFAASIQPCETPC